MKKMDVITETSLEALLQRATDPRNKSADTAAIDAFCGIIKKEPDGAFVATRLIATKIQSPQEWEALQGLSVLEACMKNCGPSFHSEIGKFRFLNEMIKLVSPKFLGARTPPPVRTQVLKLMHAWTLNYPKEPKIKEAYDMLKKQGVIGGSEAGETPASDNVTSTPSKSQPHHHLFQGEEMRLLQKLLRSKNPDDLQAANRLIQSVVKEDDRRVEIKSKTVTVLETVRTNVRLLSEMLDSYRPNQASSEEIELIKELHHGCERLRPNIFRIAADTADNDEILSQVLSVSDELGHVLDKYNTVMVLGQRVDDGRSSNGGDSKQVSSLLDFTSPTEESVPQQKKETKITTTTTSNSDLLSEPLSVLDLDLGFPLIKSKPALAPNEKPEKTNLDDIDQIFGSLNPQQTGQVPLMSSLSAAVKVNNSSNGRVTEISRTVNNSTQEKKAKSKAFEDLDILGETLMQKWKMDSGLSKPADKSDAVTPEKEDVKNALETSDDDAMMDITDVPPIAVEPIAPAKPAETETAIAKQEVKPLTDISVTLESIKPSSIPPITVIEEKSGISVTLFVAKDTPREDVTVLVVTTVSKNPSPVTNYLFQAVIPKGCKLKLQPPSGSELPAHNPFLPPSAITQILLIANPNKLDVTLKCMVSFTVDDETVTEMGEVERLPTVT